MQKKQTMHQIMLRDLKFLRYWWSCLTCVTFCWFALHETLILLSCCVFIEMVNCLNTIILKSFVIVFTSILHLFYRTNTTQNMYTPFLWYRGFYDTAVFILSVPMHCSATRGFSIYIFINTTVTFIGTSGHSVQMSWIFVSTRFFIFSLEIADIFILPWYHAL
jgi:hypothetical protein